MTQIVPFEAWHFDFIEIREPDRQEVMNIPGFRRMCEHYEKVGGAYTLLSTEGIVCIGGVAPTGLGVGSAWSVTSELVTKYPKAYYKGTRDFLNAIISDWKLHRVQATAIVDNAAAIRWLRHLGFEREGLMKKYGADKRDHYLYARVG
jgi:ribosomal protein S18 acetylase RimI-like enzyme